ncbi:MAG: AAA family ATPase, partial [Pseudomonadota bacterium]
MKILQLDLIAYGPFTERVIDFSAGVQGLHIVYGPNEAGKSSSLRALKALLYGIPERTRDNFMHPNEKLRLGGRLRHSDGSEVAIVRRKGRRNTLFGEDETPLDESTLGHYLQGVGGELFDALFGIDHAALVQGGRDILEQKGEVGQALFSAGLGTTELRGVLNALEKQAEELFLLRGSKPLLNQKLAEFREAKKAFAAASLLPRDWLDREKLLSRIGREIDEHEAELSRRNKELSRLNRIKRTFAMLARRREVLRQLEPLAGVVVLPEDFSRRRTLAQGKLDTATELLSKAVKQRQGLEEEANALTLDEAVLSHASAIEDLKERLGSYRKALSDRVHREAERAQHLHEAEKLLRTLRPDLALEEAERSLRPVLNQRKSIVFLGNRHQALAERVAQAKRAVTLADAALARARKALADLPPKADTDALRQAVDNARKAGDLDAMLKQTRDECAEMAEDCRIGLTRLGLWQGDLEGLESAAFPAMETIERFEEDFRQHGERMDAVREQMANLEKTLASVRGDLEAMRITGDVPGEDALIRSRTRRDEGWALIRRQWLDGDDVSAEAKAYDGERSLADAYEAGVSKSDDIADRLRREAERVHAKARLCADEKDATERLGVLKKEREGLEHAGVHLREKWRVIWSALGVEPLSPREMRGWHQRMTSLREQARRLRGLQANESRLAEKYRVNYDAIREALVALSGKKPAMAQDLPGVLLEAESFLRDWDETERRREKLEEEVDRQSRAVAEGNRELTDAGDEQRKWVDEWAAAVHALGLKGSAQPLEANDLLEQLAQFFGRLDAAGQLRGRVDAIDADAARFCSEVAAVAEQINPDLRDQSVEQSVALMTGMLKQNLERKALLDEKRRRIQDADEEIRTSEATIKVMRERLAELCREAKCTSVTDLDEAEQRAAERRSLTSELKQLESRLIEAGEGVAIDTLEREAENIDLTALSGEVENLRRLINDTSALLKDCYDRRGSVRTELEAMRRGGGAAGAAERTQEILAELDGLVRRYMRLKLASDVLHREIERYRERNQGPIVARASDYFSGLTCGAFKGLKTDYDESDNPVLVGLRPEGSLTRTEGMSSGTRDQLYLALRLATLEKYAAESEPMPFIVDDILINFDDDRTAATLNALGEIARKTQVILFTHHSRVVESA